MEFLTQCGSPQGDQVLVQLKLTLLELVERTMIWTGKGFTETQNRMNTEIRFVAFGVIHERD